MRENESVRYPEEPRKLTEKIRRKRRSLTLLSPSYFTWASPTQLNN